MKVCKVCSAHNSDTRTHCVECGERLGAPLSEEESAAAEQQVKEQIERMLNRNDPTHVNGYDVVLGCLQAVGLVVALLVWALGLTQAHSVPAMVGALVAFFVGMGTCFAPGFLWEITAWYRSFYSHDTQPFISAVLLRRILETAVFMAGLGLTIWSVWG